MGARDEILAAVRARRTARLPRPQPYQAPERGEPVARFRERAMAEHAEVRLLESMRDVPAAVAEILRARNLPACVHLPPDPRLDEIAWTVERNSAPPGPNDAAVALAPAAIAETGTLVYASGRETPASWHFRPGLEIAVIRAADILPTLEAVLARLGTAAATINLVTGPSRTGDIEQTLELGAHGPKALSILIVMR